MRPVMNSWPLASRKPRSPLRSQVAALALDVRMQARVAGLRVFPIGARDMCALDPELADRIGGETAQRVRIDDRESRIRNRIAAADQRLRVVLVRGIANEVRLQRAAAEHAPVDAGADRAHRDDERRLGHAEAGIDRARGEAIRRERLDELVERGGADRLGADQDDLPCGEIDALHLVGAQPRDAQVVGEIGRGGDLGAVVADRAQPGERALHEAGRREQHAERAEIHRSDHAEDQPHVVIERQPVDAGRMLAGAEI